MINNFFDISDFAKDFIKKNNSYYLKYRVIEDWGEIVGETIANFTSVVKFQNAILYIESRDPMWLSELNLAKDKIIEKYKVKYPELEFKDMRIFFNKYSFNKDEINLKYILDKKEAKDKKRIKRLDEISNLYDIKIGFFDLNES